MVSHRETFSPARLGSHSSGHLLCRRAVPGLGTFHLFLGIKISDDDDVKPVSKPCFDQQRNVVDDELVCWGLRLKFICPGCDERMQNGFQPLSSLCIGKDHLGQGRPIQAAVLVEDLRAELGSHSGQSCATGCDNVAGKLVVVEDKSPTLGEELSHRGFARRNAPGERDTTAAWCRGWCEAHQPIVS